VRIKCAQKSRVTLWGSHVCMSKDKACTKNSCWSVGIVYDARGLLGVSSACGLRVATWHMAFDDTNHIDMTKRRGSWLGVDQRER
jgi:hypothetical protein